MADGCAALGREITLLALCDPYVAAVSDDMENSHRIFRIPARLPTARRIEVFRKTIGETQIVSLQYVPFAYGRWGVAYGLADFGAAVPGGVLRHVFCHELWLDKGYRGWSAPLRGALQKAAFKRTLAAWRPAVMHTTNEIYQNRLERIGATVRKLELPSNVPVHDSSGSFWLEDQLSLDSQKGRERHWLFGLFGSIHPEWDGAVAIARLTQLARTSDRIPVFLSIGRTNDPGQRWRQWQQTFGETVVRPPLGEQPAARISEFLHKIDFGLSTNPLALTGKSTSVVAMLGHGLPVIVFRLEPELPVLFRAGQIIPADAALGERMARAVKLPPEDQLPKLAQEFLNAFQ